MRLVMEEYAGVELPAWQEFAQTLIHVQIPAGAPVVALADDIMYIHSGLVRARSSFVPGNPVLYFVDARDIVAQPATLAAPTLRIAERDMHSRSPELLASVAEFYQISAIEPTTILRFSYSTVESLATKYPQWAQMLLRVATMHVVASHMQLIEMRASPEERYLKILENHPTLPRRVAQRDLASYLNVSESALSRIVKRVNERKLGGNPPDQQ